MIGFLRGIPQVHDSHLLILCSGVGYRVAVSSQLMQQVASQSPTELQLWITPHIREDAFELYGFTSPGEQAVFNQLVAISGVGPKMALLIIAQGSNKVIQAIQDADLAFFTNIKRVGKKLAQKIIIEMKSKVGGVELSLSEDSTVARTVIEGLNSLGFSQSAVATAIKDIDFSTLTESEAMAIALKHLGNRNE